MNSDSAGSDIAPQTRTATGLNELSFPSRFTSRPPNYARNLPVAEALCKRIHPKKKSFMVPKNNEGTKNMLGKPLFLSPPVLLWLFRVFRSVKESRPLRDSGRRKSSDCPWRVG